MCVKNKKTAHLGGFLFDFSLSHIKITTEYKGKQMSNVYLDNNRIMKMKDVDKKLKKIGTWRDINTNVKLAVLMVVGLLVAAGFVMDKKQRTAKEKAKQQFKQELQGDLAKNPTKHDSVYNVYIERALSKQH